MSKEQIEKQAIEDMAKVIEITEQVARDAHCGLPSPTMYAKALYWKGYRKQSEGEWREDFDGDCYCTACGYYPKKDVKNFCPNCGAKMKGGAE